MQVKPWSVHYLVGAVIIVLVTTLYLSDVSTINSFRILILEKIQTNNNLKIIYDVSTSVCKIPYMDPYDAPVKKLLKQRKMTCWSRNKLVGANDTHLFIQESAFTQYYVKGVVECYYQSFWRIPPSGKQNDRHVKYDKSKHYFNNSIEVNEEFVRVACSYKKKEIYVDYFAFVPIKDPPGFSGNNSIDDRLNFVIIGLDSISRLNFYRQMPKTRAFVQNELNGIEFFGFNKIGDNTFPNVMGALTGYSLEEIRKYCWTTRLDNCSYIWNSFHEAGYSTVFAEEMTKYGLFTYNKPGFLNVPVMYYWETFCMELENEMDKGTLYMKKCNGYRPTLPYLLDYTFRFFKTQQKAKRKFFGFFWEAVYTHDYLNYDHKIDAYYLKHLRDLKSNHLLNDTILIFMSDHGLRFGPILQLYQGRIEERLPFMYVILPDKFKNTYPNAVENLKANTRKLTTQYDIHQTMKSFINLNYSNETKVDRGISLFSVIPENRTCSSAGIPAHWCTCQPSINVDINNKTVKYVTEYVMENIKMLLKRHSECASLTLKNIVDARVLEENFEAKQSTHLTHYTIVFKTDPGGGVFEATVKCSDCKKDFEMAGPVSRHNMYGHQSDCIHDSLLKLYCFCK